MKMSREQMKEHIEQEESVKGGHKKRMGKRGGKRGRRRRGSSRY